MTIFMLLPHLPFLAVLDYRQFIGVGFYSLFLRFFFLSAPQQPICAAALPPVFAVFPQKILSLTFQILTDSTIFLEKTTLKRKKYANMGPWLMFAIIRVKIGLLLDL